MRRGGEGGGHHSHGSCRVGRIALSRVVYNELLLKQRLFWIVRPKKLKCFGKTQMCFENQNTFAKTHTCFAKTLFCFQSVGPVHLSERNYPKATIEYIKAIS